MVEENRAQTQTEYQRNQNESETNHSSPTRASRELNDNTTNNGTTGSSLREWRVDHYELDLALSVMLFPSDKEHYDCDAHDHEEPADIDSSNHNQNERNSSESDVSRAVRSVYKSLKRTRKRINKFVKWYRRELERRNMI